MKLARISLLAGILSLGVVLIASGAFMMNEGRRTQTEVHDALVQENLSVSDPEVLLTYPGARAPEGVEVPKVLIDTAAEAHAQAEVIRMHVLAQTGGQVYTDLDREDPNRDLYLKGLTLQNSLHQAHASLELTRLVIGLGGLVVLLGAASIALGTPAVYLATKRTVR